MTKAVNTLRNRGFKVGPLWPTVAARNHPRSFGSFLSDLPNAHDVYAIVAEGRVCYIGKAQSQFIRKRFRKYTISKSYRSTAATVRAGIAEAQSEGKKVFVLHLTPPLEQIADIEAELIRELRPLWNRSGWNRDEEEDRGKMEND